MFAVKWHSVKDNRPKPYASDKDQFLDLLSDHVEREDKYQGYLYSPVTYVENSFRGNKNVLTVNAFVADLDGEELSDSLDRLAGYEFIAYTTYSHSEQEQHWHIVIPFDEPVPSHEWYSVWKQMHDFLGIVGDPQTCDPARIFFAPQHAPNAVFKTVCGTGQVMTAPQHRYSDRPPVTKSPREKESNIHHWECRCTLEKYCIRCLKDFEGLDLTGYNGMSQKEIRASIRREFLELMAVH